MAANIPLLKFNFCPLTFIGVSEQAYIDGYIGIYELQDYSLLKDVFVWAYERSAQEYLAVQKSMVQPDPIRIKNREHIHKIINKIVVERLKNYTQYVKQYAVDNVVAADRNLFEHFVLEDLKNLHEGVLARYRLKKSDLDAWRN